MNKSLFCTLLPNSGNCSWFFSLLFAFHKASMSFTSGTSWQERFLSHVLRGTIAWKSVFSSERKYKSKDAALKTRLTFNFLKSKRVTWWKTALVFTTTESTASPFHAGNVHLKRPGKGNSCLCVVYHAALRNSHSDTLQHTLAEPALYVQLFQGHWR